MEGNVHQMSYSPEVYKSAKTSLQLELWARGKKPGTTPMGPLYTDQRVIKFELGEYTAKDPEEEWAIEHHPYYGTWFCNKRAWDTSPAVRQRMYNLAKSSLAAAAHGTDVGVASPAAGLRYVAPDQSVGCPFCENYVERRLWPEHRDVIHGKPE